MASRSREIITILGDSETIPKHFAQDCPPPSCKRPAEKLESLQQETAEKVGILEHHVPGKSEGEGGLV